MDPATALAATDVALTTKLAAVLPILDAFNHRHRNQHAASHWWAAFRLLHRGSRALAADLRRHQALSQLQSDGGKKSTAAKTRAKTLQKQLLARAALLRNHTIPKAYICFSQLVADNQHATLGLLLLSVLASINSILTSISPPPQEPAAPPSAAHCPAPDAHPTDSTSKPQNRDYNADRGVTISRDRIPDATPKPPRPPKHNPNEDAAPNSRDNDSRRHKKAAPGIAKADEKPKKKAKKKGKGDELSSLFGSL